MVEYDRARDRVCGGQASGLCGCAPLGEFSCGTVVGGPFLAGTDPHIGISLMP